MSKGATIIFRTTPEKKEQFKKDFELSYKAALEAYRNEMGMGKAWDRYHEHPKSVGEWVEACAVQESAARVKNLKALKAKRGKK